jgi:hypothetical protein
MEELQAYQREVVQEILNNSDRTEPLVNIYCVKHPTKVLRVRSIRTKEHMNKNHCRGVAKCLDLYVEPCKHCRDNG